MAEINIIVRARDAATSIISGISGKIEAMGKQMGRVWEAAWKPAAVAFAAYAAFAKVIDLVQKALARKEKALIAVRDARAKETADALAESYANLSRSVSMAEAALKRQGEIQKANVTSSRALADAQSREAEERAVAAAATQEEADAIRAKFDAQRQETKAQRDYEDATLDRAKADAEANIKRREAQALAGQLAQLEAELLEQTQRAAYAKQMATGNWNKVAREAYEAEAKAATETADKLRSQIESTRDRRITVLGEITVAEAESAAAIRGQQTAIADKTASELERRNKATKDAADKRVEIERKAAEEVAKLTKEKADAEAAIAKDLEDERKEALEQELADAEKKQEAANKLAQTKVEDFIAEQRAGKDAEKQAQRDLDRQAKLEDKIKRGTKLSRADQEWLDAQQAIMGGRANAANAAEQAKVARENLDQIEKTKREEERKELQDRLRRIETKLTNLGMISDNTSKTVSSIDDLTDSIDSALTRSE